MTGNLLTINASAGGSVRARVLIIYTGGTFGMIRDSSGVLKPFDFSLILEHLPALRGLNLEISVISFEKPIDSSDMEPSHWIRIATLVRDHYDRFDGFVVLHGTDTMAFTASALSYMLVGLSKAVVFTGAQLPISDPRSDARENLITALEIASAYETGAPVVPEVCIFFGDELIRGCRARKAESMHFDAFQSENYPLLARSGVRIEYSRQFIRKVGQQKLTVLTKFDPAVSIVKLFPGMSKELVSTVLRSESLRGVVMETYGSGNAPSAGWFIDELRKALGRGVVIVNVSQCVGGEVQQGKYETSRLLEEIGVIGGGDMTTEAAVTKMMLMLGEYGVEGCRQRMRSNLAGEISE